MSGGRLWDFVTCSWLSISLCVMCPPRTAAADPPTPAEEFRSQSPGEQRENVLKALRDRLTRSAANIVYEIETVFQICELDAANVVGKPVAGTESRTRIRHWRIDDSYRMERIYAASLDPKAASSKENMNFDASAGVSRIVAWPSGESGRIIARIDPVPSSMADLNRYAYFLDGKHTSSGEFVIRYLVDRADLLTVEMPAEGAMVHVTIPWQPRFLKQPAGLRTLTLDPARGFLPVSGLGSWKRDKQWRREEFEVSDARLVNGLWMPIQLREVVSASPGRPRTAGVYETRVLSIELGRVTPQDLAVSFPEGAEVVDTIEGVRYVTDGNEKPAGRVEPLTGRPSRSTTE